MNPVRPTRRSFLGSLGGAVAASAALPGFLRAEEALARELGALQWDPARPGGGELAGAYELDPSITYLNHASIGTMPRAVREALGRYLGLCESNPWLYMWSGAWDEALESARRSLAGLVGAPADEVAITHNTTEGFNVLARGLPLEPGDEVLFSTLNHAGASVAWEHVAPERGLRVRRFDLPVSEAPGLTPGDVVELHLREIREETRVLVVPHVDNVVGIRHPLRELAAGARDRGVDFVVVDGAQTVGMLPLDLPGSGVDAYAGSPHKWVQSPKGLGLLWLPPSMQETLRPLWVTWGQTRWAGTIRVYEDYGTRNLPEALALGDAADFQHALGTEEKERRLRRIHGLMRQRVDASPGLEWRSPRSWHDGASLVAVHVAGRSAAREGRRLWRDHGVVVRAFEGGGLDHLRISPNVMTDDTALHRFFDLLDGGTAP